MENFMNETRTQSGKLYLPLSITRLVQLQYVTASAYSIYTIGRGATLRQIL